MATTIKLKNGSGAPLAGDLVQGEPALDLTNKRLYTEDSGGTVIEVGTNPTSLTTGTFTSTGIDDNATSTAITIDSSENVGIGTASPVSLGAGYKNIDVRHTTGGGLTLGDTSNIHAYLFSDNNGVTLQSPGSRSIKFTTGSTERMRIDANGKIFMNEGVPFSWADGSQNVAAEIYGDSSDNLVFRNTSAKTERMRIDSSGNLLFNTTNTLTSAELTAGETGIALRSGDLIIVSRDGGSGLLVNRKTSDGDLIDFRKNGTTVGSIGTEGGDLTIGTGDTGVQFGDSGDYIRPWNTSTNANRDAAIDLGVSTSRFKDLYLSGGAYLGGTGAANHLDDYEEGTFSPTISSGTASFSNATYTKVGRVVVVTVFFQSVSDQSSTTALQVGNLPFTSDSNTFSAHTGLSRHFNRGDGTIVAYMGGSSNVLNFYALDLGADYLAVRHQDLNNAGANYYATITYIAA